MRTRTLLVSAAVPLVFALAACAPTPTPSSTPEPEETFVAASPEPAPIPTLGAPDADTTLIVRATVTADNGAQLALEMRVHQSTAFDNVGNQTLPAAMIEDCPGAYTQEIFSQNLWSFTRVNVTSIPTAASTADWPAEKRIDIHPSASFAPIAARGFIANDDEVSGETPTCKRDKFFTGYGQGGIAIGIPGDTDAVGAAGGFTRWANHSYGFDTRRVASQTAVDTGVTLSDCSFEVTDLGRQFNGGADWWASLIDESTCTTGASPEAQEY